MFFFCVFMLYCLPWTDRFAVDTISLITPSKRLCARWTFLRFFFFFFFLHFFAALSQWSNVPLRDRLHVTNSPQPKSSSFKHCIASPRNKSGETQAAWTTLIAWWLRARAWTSNHYSLFATPQPAGRACVYPWWEACGAPHHHSPCYHKS